MLEKDFPFLATIFLIDVTILSSDKVLRLYDGSSEHKLTLADRLLLCSIDDTSISNFDFLYVSITPIGLKVLMIRGDLKSFFGATLSYLARDVNVTGRSLTSYFWSKIYISFLLQRFSVSTELGFSKRSC